MPVFKRYFYASNVYILTVFKLNTFLGQVKILVLYLLLSRSFSSKRSVPTAYLKAHLIFSSRSLISILSAQTHSSGVDHSTSNPSLMSEALPVYPETWTCSSAPHRNLLHLQIQTRGKKRFGNDLNIASSKHIQQPGIIFRGRFEWKSEIKPVCDLFKSYSNRKANAVWFTCLSWHIITDDINGT